MFEVLDHTVGYGQSEVISKMNFDIKKNEIVAIVGRNGMGKTTLMKSLIGMIPSVSGEIKLGGKNLEGLKSYERVASGVAFVPQGRMIFSTMTVSENIKTGLTSVKDKDIPEYLYELFPVLKEMKFRRGGNLSGGQQQQLAIARALASKPDLLLLDEPTEGIQPSIIHDMARNLKRIRDEIGLSIIVSEQVLSFALDIADRIFVIEKGEIVREEDRASVDEKKIAAYLSV
ncbi:urea ABC transporter ATP-binding subunit UrtE [Teredinibacter franksiae]|uniref:urea ABC transporter ATP-binding subunit UrtE n=1 Tax=Teredinibacter franksiae TaxID=2761453 RepID=UPI001625D6FA|nr:urea ABC transporter ATP-binding subunit UrtE [Teredinibacter franksiae]